MPKSNHSVRLTVFALCRIAVMAALYIPLAKMAIEIGTLKLSFGSLPVTVLAMLTGPWEAAAAAAIGELIKQLLGYGLTLTTLLWVIPPVLRGLIIGLAAQRLLRRGQLPEQRPLWCYTAGVAAALVTTIANTFVLWADSVIFHYYFPGYITGNLAIRLVTGVIIAVLVATISIPVVHRLRQQGLGRRI